MLAAYFVPAFVVLLRHEPDLFTREPRQGLVYSTVVLVVIACFCVAAKRLFNRQNSERRAS